MTSPDELMTKEWKYDFRESWEKATADLRYISFMKNIDLRQIGFTNELLNNTYIKMKRRK